MKKISTVATNRNEIFKEHKLTIGLDLGDRCSYYCILDEGSDRRQGTKRGSKFSIKSRAAESL